MGLVVGIQVSIHRETGDRTMRVSEAALALITRVNAQSETEYLTQWNETWHAYSLIGGHVEAGESFRECCVQEVEEELELRSEIDFRLASEAMGPINEYDEVSKAAGVLTNYRIQVFSTQILSSTFRDMQTGNVPAPCLQDTGTLLTIVALLAVYEGKEEEL